MSDTRVLSYRAGFGLALGTAAGIVFYVAYKEQWRKRFWKRKFADDENLCNQLCTPLHHEHSDLSLQQHPVSHFQSQVCLVSQESTHMDAGDAPIPSSACCGETEILARLDFIFKSVTELRQEVGELRNSLQGIAVDIVGQLKSHITESQKATRRRKFLLHRERSDSTGSSSVYFTATSGRAYTDGESEGGYTTANPESDYDRESGRESDEDDVSCETVKTVRRDSMDLVNEEEPTLTFDSIEDEELYVLQHIAKEKDDEVEDDSDGSQQLPNQNHSRTDFVLNGQLEDNPEEFEH